MTRTDGYLLDNRQDEAAERFDAFAALFDPTTFRHLERLGTGAGWHCWEVGAGGTSVVSWLAERVGSVNPQPPVLFEVAPRLATVSCSASMRSVCPTEALGPPVN